MSDLSPWMAPWSGRLLTLAVVLLGAGLIIWSLRVRRQNTGEPRCQRCGYNMAGASSLSCPECGHTAENRAQLFIQRQYKSWAIVGLLVALSLPVYVVQGRMRVYGWDYYLALYPMYAVWPEHKLSDQTVRGLCFRFYRDRRVYYNERLLITIDEETIFNEKDDRWMFGERYEGLAPSQWFFDIDNDGADELLVISNAGGNASDNDNRILSFDFSNEPPRFLGMTRVTGRLTFDDHNGDGDRDIRHTSHFYRHNWTSGAGSPYPVIWLRFVDGQLIVDKKLSRQPLPDEKTVQDVLAQSDEIDSYAPALWLALDMIYSGHAAEGENLLQAVNPIYARKFNSEQQLLSEPVMACVQIAPFGKEILAMSSTTP